MPFCAQCGTQANPDAKFCSGCGQPLGGARPTLVAPSEKATDSARLEALELGPEIMDTETFFGLCQNEPDEALLKISKLEAGLPELGEAYPVPFFKFLALSRKALKACELNGGEPDANVLALCGECLRAYPRAKSAAKAADADEMMQEPFIKSSLDAVAVLAEKGDPGRVQEALAVTKLMYAMMANRVDMSNAVKAALTSEELLEALEFPVTEPFIVRAALFARVVNLSNAKVLSIMLYEQTDVWGPSEQMNPIKGQLHLKKDDTVGSQWRQLSSTAEINEVLQAISE